jgi:hypothetical protein
MRKLNTIPNIWIVVILIAATGLAAGFYVQLKGEHQLNSPVFSVQADDDEDEDDEAFTDSFMIETCEFSPVGSNPYFVLEPGYQLVLEGEDDGEQVRLVITVLNETKVVDGVETRVVEERESQDGKLVEVSRNYFAICTRTNSVFYFGEDVDLYRNGRIVGHDGSWQAGVDDARPGIIMPGTVLLGARYYQEIAPEVALDRAEIESLTGTLRTPAGEFTNVLETEETTPLEPDAEEFKFYAPGIGLIKDGPLELVSVTR